MRLAPILKGIFFSFYFFVTINIGVVYLFFAWILLRPFSRKLWVKAIGFIQDTYLSQIVYLIEKTENVVFEQYGDPISSTDAAIIIPNHQNHDYFILYPFADRTSGLGNVRTILKNETKYLPGFGWTMWLANWPYVSRNFERDGNYLQKLFKSYAEDGVRVGLWLFPEGTRRTPSKLKASQEYAQQKGYPVFKNVMLPRPKGFRTAVQALRNSAAFVYDVTLAYDGWGVDSKGNDVVPGPLTLLFDTQPDKLYRLQMHVKAIPLDQVPCDDPEETHQWLLKRFAEKDELLEYWKKNGHTFPGKVVAGGVEEKKKRTLTKFNFPILMWSSSFCVVVSVASYWIFHLIW